MPNDDPAGSDVRRHDDADRPEQQPARDAWRRLGRLAGFFAGAAFLVQSALFLLDATGALAPHTTYRTSGRGLEQDLIDYYVSHSERMHSIWWDVAVRDLVGPLGYLALMVVVHAVVHVAGTNEPRQELGRLFVVLGAAAAALSDLMYLGHVAWWRQGPLLATPDIIAHARAFEVVDIVGERIQWAGLLVLALGFVCLAGALGGDSVGPRWLTLLAYLQAGALVAFVATNAAGADVASFISALAAGIVFGPLLAVLVGRGLGAEAPAQVHDGASESDLSSR